MIIKLTFTDADDRQAVEDYMRVVGTGSYFRSSLLDLQYNIDPMKYGLFSAILQRCPYYKTIDTIETPGCVERPNSIL